MKKCKTYEVKLHIGSIRGYNGNGFTKGELVRKIGEFQTERQHAAISVRVTPTMFVFREYAEEGWEVVGINYARFPKEKKNIKRFMRDLAKYLLKEFEQNRITVTEPNQSVMFESDYAEENP